MAVNTYNDVKAKKWEDFQFLEDLFISIGKSFDDGYAIDQENRNVIHEVLKYFFLPSKTKLNPIKGLLIYGKVGSGKTMIFQVINRMLQMQRDPFNFIRCQDVIEQFQIHGERCLANYSRNQDAFFDDIGEEQSEQKRWGNKANPIQMVMSKRYLLFQNSKVRTFGTTNLTASQINERYGERIESRFEEMFNVLGLGVEESYVDRRMSANPAKKELSTVEIKAKPLSDKEFIEKNFIPHFENYKVGQWTFPEHMYRYLFRLLYRNGVIKLTVDEIEELRKEAIGRIYSSLSKSMKIELDKCVKKNNYNGLVGEKVNGKAAEISLINFITSTEMSSEEIVGACC